MRTLTSIALLGLAAWALSACGGGGSTPADPPTPPSANKPAFEPPPAPGEKPR